MPPAAAGAELRSCAGSQFDPEIVEAFLATLTTNEAADSPWPVAAARAELVS
ncbi:MAG TPA: hypothetical protein VII87_14155 [Solirubrobacteraceae bacterium]|jgi:response regulator RpfG family c-di-GMP phosphodiesterase